MEWLYIIVQCVIFHQPEAPWVVAIQLIVHTVSVDSLGK